MPTFTMTKTYEDGDPLTESDLDGMKTSTETFLNTTKIDADNIQNSGITTATIADNAVDKDKLAADGAGKGLSQNADGSYETDSEEHNVVMLQIFA